MFHNASAFGASLVDGRRATASGVAHWSKSALQRLNSCGLKMKQKCIRNVNILIQVWFLSQDGPTANRCKL